MLSENGIFNYIFHDKKIVDVKDKVNDLKNYYLQSYFFNFYNSSITLSKTKKDLIGLYKNIKTDDLEKIINIMKNTKKETFEVEKIPNFFSYNINPRIIFLKASYSSLLKNDQSKQLINNARNEDDLLSIVIIDELINVLNRESISYKIEISSSINENLIQLSKSYELINKIKSLKDDNFELHCLESITRNLFENRSLGSAIDKIVRIKQKTKKYSESYNNFEKKLSKHTLFLENKDCLNNTKANIKNIENKIKKNLDIEMKDVTNFYKNFDLNKTKKEIDSNYGRFNLLLDHYTKLSYDNEKLARLQNQTKNKNNYYIDLIHGKEDLNALYKILKKDNIYFDKPESNYLTKNNIVGLLNIRSRTDIYENQFSITKKNYKELAVILPKYKNIIDEIKRKVNSRAISLKKQIDTVADDLEKKAYHLIHSKFVFNRDSKIERYKSDLLHYKGLEDKLKCLN